MPAKGENAGGIGDGPAQAALTAILVAAFHSRIFFGGGPRRAGRENTLTFIAFCGTHPGPAGKAGFAPGNVFGIGGIKVARPDEAVVAGAVEHENAGLFRPGAGRVPWVVVVCSWGSFHQSVAGITA